MTLQKCIWLAAERAILRRYFDAIPIDQLISYTICDDASVCGLNTSVFVNIRSPASPAASEGSPCASPQPSTFGEGWRASDNSMFDSVQASFPTGQLSKKTKGMHEIFRPSTGNVDAQLQRMRITPAKAVLDKRRVLGAIPKRISLPENLEVFSYQMAQKHSLTPAISPLLADESPCVPLSPIEDLRSFDDESMDVS
uniref:Uncharacterized protein n=1 Tax=Parascaris equorum TaxID=6256 RepID=A0A914RJ28_PAREQ